MFTIPNYYKYKIDLVRAHNSFSIKTVTDHFSRDEQM